MIGLFDSGHGGLTIFRALSERFPDRKFVYLGDHANVPYGDRSSDEIVGFTRAGVETLFDQGCSLVLLACNTATAVAARTLQQDWLPSSGHESKNILGIIAPTVEAATQTPWAVTQPQYPQMYNRDRIAIFGTTRTITTDVYGEEIRKRCPEAELFQLACPELAKSIERDVDDALLEEMVATYVRELVAKLDGAPLHQAILGCTHYPLVEHYFAKYLPAHTRILSQPEIVANSLEFYLGSHPQFLSDDKSDRAQSLLLTTGVDALPTSDRLATFKRGLVFHEV